jgi:hypothetical protein
MTISCQQKNDTTPPQSTVSHKSLAIIPQIIKTSITPGKPNADTEQIILIRKENGCALSVKRINSTNEVFADFNKDIDCVLMDAVWQKLVDRDILDFNITPLDIETFDYGERVIYLEWTHKGSVEPESKLMSWIGPIQDEASLDFIFDDMYKLYDKSEFELFYYN